MPKFFVKENQIIGEIIHISGEDAVHIKKVLRHKKGDIIVVCDGKSSNYEAKIVELENEIVTAEIVNKIECKTEPPLDIVLYQALPKSNKMELIIQKCVELGIDKIVPMVTERTIVKINSDKDMMSKIERWQKISVEAAKQCGRCKIPVVDKPVLFKEAVMNQIKKSGHAGIMAYENHQRSGLKEYCRKNNGISKFAIFVGPEGGFSDKEVLLSVENGIEIVSLGPRILRTETAGFVLLSILMYELGDVG